MEIPERFQKTILDIYGKVGQDWLNGLERTVQTYSNEWGLRLKGTVANLSYNYVLKGEDASGQPIILKLGVPTYDFTNEIRTLEAYQGQGCAQLLRADPIGGAILQEQLVPGRMLKEVEDEREALEIFIIVWKSLKRSVPSELHCPTIKDWAQGIERYQDSYPNGNGPITSAHCDQARTYFQEIWETSTEIDLLHGDLHQQNILFLEEKGWMAIDPKGVAGDAYFGFTSFLVNELHHKSEPEDRLKRRVDYLVNQLDLNRDRFLKASFAMAILYACWGIEDHDSEWKTAYQCARWLEQMHV